MKIAVIENQDETATAMKKILKRGGYEVTLFTGNEDTGSIVTEIQKNNLAILDIELEKESGIHILKKLRKVDRSFPVILIMACLSPESIIEASQFGVREMLQKPLDYEELLNTVRKCDMLSRDVVDTTEGLDGDNFIGSYKTMGDIYRKIGIAAANGLNVMLIGETGVGKELVARQIHAFSDRKKGNFTAINCTAIPKELFESEVFGYEKGAFTGADSRKIGLIEQANNGVLFFDEIGEMDVSLQSKLLRFLETRKFIRVGGNKYVHSNAKIVSASNCDLGKSIEQGLFRKDLYYRLSPIVIRIPPLRERKGDIPELARYFVNKANRELFTDIKDIADEALERLANYNWPGNVRESKNVIYVAALNRYSGIITAEDIKIDDGLACSDTDGCIKNCMKKLLDQKGIEMARSIREQIEAQIIEILFEKTGNNISRTAEYLGLARNTLKSKLKKYGGNRVKDRVS